MLNTSGADEMIIATGGTAKKLPVPGIENDHVIEAVDLLLKRKQAGDSVVVIGGGLTGCEIAYDLAKNGKKVSIVEMMADILQISGLSAANGNMLRELLDHHHVDIRTAAKLCEITPSGVRIAVGNEEEVLAAESVVLAAGYNPAPLVQPLEGSRVHVIGDASHVGNLMDVIWAAYDVALQI
jgi:2-enoate reductase